MFSLIYYEPIRLGVHVYLNETLNYAEHTVAAHNRVYIKQWPVYIFQICLQFSINIGICLRQACFSVNMSVIYLRPGINDFFPEFIQLCGKRTLCPDIRR